MEKQMVKALQSIHSALSRLDDRIRNIEVKSDIDYGDISKELDEIESVINLLEGDYE